MATRIMRLGVSVAYAATFAACSPFEPRHCTDELRIQYSPRAPTVRVGESFRASIALSSCGGHEKLSDTFTWSAADATIIRVEASTGRVTALAPGETYLIVTGQRYGNLGGVVVTVQPSIP